jgi:hypothetical protein
MVLVTILTCIQEVLGSNLSRDTSYPDRCFPWSSSIVPVAGRISTSIRPRQAVAMQLSSCQSTLHNPASDDFVQ